MRCFIRRLKFYREREKKREKEAALLYTTLLQKVYQKKWKTPYVCGNFLVLNVHLLFLSDNVSEYTFQQ